MSGQVQGVGFRPFVYRLARELGLCGSVRNEADGVRVECQGPPELLDEFATRLRGEAPPLARVRDIRTESLPVDPTLRGFRIEPSRSEPSPGADVTVDTALCPDCLRELLSPEDRRYGYGLITCTHCGPRFTIVRRITYDRCNTTMAGFAMCDRCRAEYEDPADRRFHAQPIACHDCGPRVRIADCRAPGAKGVAGDPIADAARRLAEGQTVAIKGLGGYHLAVRADDREAVGRLRRAKVRDAKPFALMVRDLEAARQLVELSDAAEAAMRSPACPIILARRCATARVAEDVAPRSHRLGVMLPYTPIHHLLWKHLPADVTALVMTSGNVADEPLVIDDADAFERLGPMADAILRHDRPIERGVDDSVFIDAPGGLTPVRRARGYAPAPIALPADGGGPGLCVGGDLKSTVAVVRDGRAVLSQHLGDLAHPRAYANFRKAVEDLLALFEVTPAWVAHDEHPAYLSTRFARELAARWKVPLVGVQHHHAHAAALMAEHGVAAGPILALACDGTGYGEDGTTWGCELLAADLTGSRRLASLVPIPLAGADAAARDARRPAAAILRQALGEAWAEHRTALRMLPDARERTMLATMLRRGVSCPPSTGLGRWFDGAAAIVGACARNRYEAEAAMTLEALAEGAERDHEADGDDLFALRPADEAGVTRLDLTRLTLGLLERQQWGWPAEELAALFHEQLARGLAAMAAAGATRTRLATVGLTGGVFCNARLTARLARLLEGRGLRVLRHAVVPPGDGGISLGQAAVASARMAGRAQAGPTGGA